MADPRKNQCPHIRQNPFLILWGVYSGALISSDRHGSSSSLFVFSEVVFERVFEGWSAFPDEWASPLLSPTCFAFDIWVSAFAAAEWLCCWHQCLRLLRLSSFVDFILACESFSIYSSSFSSLSFASSPFSILYHFVTITTSSLCQKVFASVNVLAYGVRWFRSLDFF